MNKKLFHSQIEHFENLQNKLPEMIQNVILTHFFACHTNRVNNK